MTFWAILQPLIFLFIFILARSVQDLWLWTSITWKMGQSRGGCEVQCTPGHTPDNAKLDLQSSGKTGIFPSPELSDLFSPYFQDFRKFLSSFLISKRHVNFLTAVQWSPRHSRRRCALGRAVQCDRCGCKEGCKTFSSLPRAVFTLSCPGFQQQAGKIWESSEMQAGQKIRLRCEPN